MTYPIKRNSSIGWQHFTDFVKIREISVLESGVAMLVVALVAHRTDNTFKTTRPVVTESWTSTSRSNFDLSHQLAALIVFLGLLVKYLACHTQI